MKSNAFFFVVVVVYRKRRKVVSQLLLFGLLLSLQQWGTTHAQQGKHFPFIIRSFSSTWYHLHLHKIGFTLVVKSRWTLLSYFGCSINICSGVCPRFTSSTFFLQYYHINTCIMAVLVCALKWDQWVIKDGRQIDSIPKFHFSLVFHRLLPMISRTWTWRKGSFCKHINAVLICELSLPRSTLENVTNETWDCLDWILAYFFCTRLVTLDQTNTGGGSNLESGEGDFEEAYDDMIDADGTGNSEYEDIDAEGLFHFLFLLN